MDRSTKYFCAILGIALFAGAAYSQLPPQADGKARSPIFGISIPDGYRKWQLVAPAHEPAFNEFRAVLGNTLAMDAYEKGALPFPDGTTLVKLAWLHMQSEEFEPAYVPGMATTVQVMVKDSKKYASTGGWGFGKFIDGKPVEASEHEGCFACHEAHVKNHDFVFTRFAR